MGWLKQKGVWIRLSRKAKTTPVGRVPTSPLLAWWWPRTRFLWGRVVPVDEKPGNANLWLLVIMLEVLFSWKAWRGDPWGDARARYPRPLKPVSRVAWWQCVSGCRNWSSSPCCGDRAHLQGQRKWTDISPFIKSILKVWNNGHVKEINGKTPNPPL